MSYEERIIIRCDGRRHGRGPRCRGEIVGEDMDEVTEAAIMYGWFLTAGDGEFCRDCGEELGMGGPP